MIGFVFVDMINGSHGFGDSLFVNDIEPGNHVY